MRSMSKISALGLLAAGTASLLFSLHTVHIQNRSVGSRLSEMVVRLAHMWPDKIDDNYIRKMMKINSREYVIPTDIIVDSRLESSFSGEMKVFRMSSEKTTPKKCVLYLHGGGYINQPSLFHWWFLDKLVEETRIEFFIPIYPKTPEFTYDKSYSMLIEFYKRLIQKEYSEIILMGDSAGGGLALGISQMLREENIRQPKEIILISPWLDISLNNKDIREYEKADPMLHVDNLKKIGRMWAGNSNLESFQLSPLYGNLNGLGRISIFIGTREVCYPDAAKFSEMLTQQEIEHHYYEYNMMNHNFPLYPIREGTTSRAQIASRIR